MKNFFKKYLWVFEFIGVAIIITLGVYVKINPKIFLYIVGITLIVFGVLRLFPLLKTTKDKVLKVIYLVEILLNVGAGIWLISEGGKDPYNENLMRYLVGGILYLRGFLYFFSTVIRKESSDYVKFFLHIALITLGPIIIVKDYFNEEILSWIVLIAAILSAIFIGLSGFRNYKNFRYEQLAKDETQRIVKKEKKEAIIEDRKEDPAPLKEDIIIPEEEKRDEIVS